MVFFIARIQVQNRGIVAFFHQNPGNVSLYFLVCIFMPYFFKLAFNYVQKRWFRSSKSGVIKKMQGRDGGGWGVGMVWRWPTYKIDPFNTYFRTLSKIAADDVALFIHSVGKDLSWFFLAPRAVSHIDRFVWQFGIFMSAYLAPFKQGL